MLTFIDGEVPSDLAFHDDESLRRAASLIRRFHDISAELLAAPAAAVGLEVICHNDLSPCNFVFRRDSPIAMIDFDSAAPGSRVHDLGYAVWLWLDLGSPEIPATDQRRRLAIFLEAYELADPAPILEAMLERQAILIAEGERLGNADIVRWATRCMGWTRNNSHMLRGEF
jgi:Ser/Thr protein kinase RdoA (MazF antagonist)